MLRVHAILALVLALALVACRTGDRPGPPRLHEEPDPVVEEGPEPVERPVPKGFVGNPADATFHRLDCPAVEEIPAATRHYFATPHDALNEKFHPCEECGPLSGWR